MISITISGVTFVCLPTPSGGTQHPAPVSARRRTQLQQLLRRRASHKSGRWITTTLQVGFGRRRERKMLALPDTIAVLGTDIPFWYATGGFVLALIVLGGKNLVSSFRLTSVDCIASRARRT